MNHIVFYWLFAIILASSCQDDSTAERSPSKTTATSYTLRLGHTQAPDSSLHAAAVTFSQLVSTATNGRVQVTLHPDRSLGNEHQLIELARAGLLDIVLASTAQLSQLSPTMALLDLPFLFPSVEACDRVLDGVAGRALLKTLAQHQLLGAGFWEGGFKYLTSNRPLNAPESFKGITFPVPRSNILREQFEALGAQAVVISRHKTYQALEDSAVNAQENSLHAIRDLKLQKLQSHLTTSRHGYLTQVVSFSTQAFSRLPKNLRETVLSVVTQTSHKHRAESRAKEAAILKELEATGTQVVHWTEGEREKIRALTWPLLEKHRLEIGTGIVERTIQELEVDRFFTPEELVIGIDADMSGNSALSGLAIRRGAELAVAEINERGGVLGKRLTLSVRDNSMIPARGLANLEHFRKLPQLVAVLGGISSPVALAEVEFIHENQLLYLDPWAAATPIVKNGRTPNYVFRVSVRDEYAGAFLVPEALKISSKVAFLLVNNGWGRSNHAAMTSQLAEKGLKPHSVQWFDWGEKGHGVKIEEIYRSGAEVIVYVGNGVEGAKFFQLLSKRNKALPVISHWGITGGEFHKFAHSVLEEVDLRVLQTFAFLNNKRPEAVRLLAMYKQRYLLDEERDVPAVVGTAHAYDLVHLLALAIARAQSTEAPKIRGALEELKHYSGAVKDYAPPFTPEMHDALDAQSFFLAKYSGATLVPLP